VGNEIYAYGHSEAGGGRAMATTLVAAVVWRERLIVANVGDSRAYLLRGGHAEQITVDHNLVGEMVQEGLMTEEEARRSKVKNRLTRSLGGRPDPKVDIFTRTLQTGDRIVLCSDGLTRYASAEDIVRLAGEAPPEEAVQRLIDFANQQGGADNISAIVIAVGEAIPVEAWTSTGTPTRLVAPQALDIQDEGAPAPSAPDKDTATVPTPAPAGEGQPQPADGAAALLKRWWWLPVVMGLVGCLIGGALWWGLSRRKAAVPPTPLPAISAPLTSPTPMPPPTPTPSPVPTFTATPAPLPSPTPFAVAPLASPTWTALPSGQYACLGKVLAGGTFYGLLREFGLLTYGSDEEFWQQWARTGRFRQILTSTLGRVPEGKVLDYHRDFDAVPVPQQEGPGSPQWKEFLDSIHLYPNSVVLLPAVGREQCERHDGLWRQFVALPPWMRENPTPTPATPIPTP